ncbi:MAG: VCBS repeat-containing protein, partial [Anaerolineae bacterium]|nr:VCBS repeat-containing protein [Anaerolineae bacterium]
MEDVNNDGRIDLTVLTEGIDKIYLNENGRFPSDSQNPFTFDWQGSFLAWGDVDGDGDTDLTTANETTVNIFLNNGISLQTIGRPLPNTTNGARDTNGDGLFAFNDVENAFLGNSAFVERDGSFQIYNQSRLNINLNEPVSTWILNEPAWGDFDNDGDLDLAVVQNYGTSGWTRGGRVAIYKNDLTTKGEFTRIILDWTDYNFQADLAWGDVDNDGDLDLAIGLNGQNSLYLNNNYSFTPASNWGAADWYSADREATTSIAWGDMDQDGDLDLAAGNRDGTNVVYLNSGGRLQPLPIWESRETDSTTAVAWGDVDGDGDLDLAVGNANGHDKIYLNQNGLLETSPIWASAESTDTTHLVWADMDDDGDLDLATDQLMYINNQIKNNQLANSYPSMVVYRPIAPDETNFSVPTQVVSETVIAIPFTLSDPENSTIAYLEGQYSLDGGGQWISTVPTNTETTNLVADGRSRIFNWDTFASNFFGQSDNVVFRLIAHTQPPASQISVTGTYRYINGLPLNVQRPFVSATTLPFRVRGTQIRVFNEDQISVENDQPDAVVYRLTEGTFSAQLMRSATSLQPFVTDPDGYLEGRGILEIGDLLMALTPISRTYRIPPQLLLDGESYAEVASLSQAPDTAFTAEFWLYPTGTEGTLLELGTDFSWRYSTQAETTNLTLTVKND